MTRVGSIWKRRTNRDGTTSYLLRCMINYKEYKKTVRCTSYTQADRELKRFYSECESGRINTGSINWPELCDIWMEEYAAQVFKRTTYENTISHINYRIKPAFRKQARKITRTDVQKWVNGIAKELAPKTVRNCYGLMAQIFAWAVKKEYLSVTPCQYVDMPRANKREAHYLDEETFAKVMDLLPKEPLAFQSIMVIALFGGLRKGEILGLCWGDIDMDTGAAVIQRTRLQNRQGAGSFVDTPKSNNSIRRIIFPELVIRTLQRYKLEQKELQLAYGARYNKNDYVICLDNGKPLAPATAGRWLDKFRERNNLPHFTLHSLRHTHASLLRYLGADIDEIQKRLGHADKAVTEHIYTHMFESFEKQDRSIADKLDAFLKAE